MQAVTLEHAVTAPVETAPCCTGCGAVLYAGQCMALGTCEIADRRASRGAARDTSKMQAWTISGGVD